MRLDNDVKLISKAEDSMIRYAQNINAFSSVQENGHDVGVIGKEIDSQCSDEIYRIP